MITGFLPAHFECIKSLKRMYNPGQKPSETQAKGHESFCMTHWGAVRMHECDVDSPVIHDRIMIVNQMFGQSTERTQRVIGNILRPKHRPLKNRRTFNNLQRSAVKLLFRELENQTADEFIFMDFTHCCTLGHSLSGHNLQSSFYIKPITVSTDRANLSDAFIDSSG